MRIRRVSISRFRGIERLSFQPGPRTVILGPNNAGKSTVLEALDLLLHPGLGRPRHPPEETDYFNRDPSLGFEIEAVLGDLPGAFKGEVVQHLEGWRDAGGEVVAEPDGQGIEAVARVRVRGTAEFEFLHEFAKPESEGARFHPRLRAQVGWVFDGRTRDPARELSFYQGGLLERLFSGAELDPALQALRGALGTGAEAVNRDAAVAQVLQGLSQDLQAVGLLRAGESAGFEAGAVSPRALLQALRLTLPAVDVRIPLSGQGRGAQRLVLVAVLLRLAKATGLLPVGGFEEPEEALEPLRQAQLTDMLRDIASDGGQVFIVTHSPDVARRFSIDDFLLLHERAAGRDARHLLRALSPPVRQAYERRLDGAVVRGLFCRIPLLVEGPGDRAVVEVFWRELARAGTVLPAHRLGLDVINCEGVDLVAMHAQVLHEAGKTVVALVDQDSKEARERVSRLKSAGHCAAILFHDPSAGRDNLERALAWGCSLEALIAALEAVAADRGYSWDNQRNDLLSRLEIEREVREQTKAKASLAEFLHVLGDARARQLAAAAFGAERVAPFEMKGARQGRIVAETIVRTEGVPPNFARALEELNTWIANGCAPRGVEIQMVTGG